MRVAQGLLLLLLLFSFAKSYRRIVNGNFTAVKQFPSFVQISLPSGSYCGGSILTTTRVLTASHCIFTVENETMPYVDIYAGSIEFNKGDHYTGEVFEIKVDVDLAILKVIPDITFTPYVRPIQLTHVPIEAGTKCTVIGYGITETGYKSSLLKYADVTINSHKDVYDFLAINPYDDLLERQLFYLGPSVIFAGLYIF